MDDGVRQGDSTSSFFFCIGVDEPLEELVGKGYHCWMYCDDLTIVARRSEIDECMANVASAFARVGLAINHDKTEIFNPQVPREDPFILLGCDLANTKRFFDDKLAKQRLYFDTLDMLPLHPQLKTTLLRLCGAPRITYLLRAMPPQFTETLAAEFDKMLLASLARTLSLDGPDDLPLEMVYHRFGSGLPRFNAIRSVLYNSSRDEAINDIKSTVELVQSDPDALSNKSARHNLDASWLWYNDKMSPAEFIAAYCARIGFLPPHLRLHPIKCHCGTMVTSDAIQIYHTFRCDRFTKTTHATRHNMVRDEFCRVTTQYGISTTKEPTVYSYVAGKKRPDALFHTSKPIATDFTIVMPHDVPGDAATNADESKTKMHASAVKQLGHVFVPAAAEAYGLMGKQFTRLINLLTAELPPQHQWGFHAELHRSVATAMARSRAAALFGAKWYRDECRDAP